MIKITSLKKQGFSNGQPTSELYTIESYINPANIISIMPTKTSIKDYANNIDYYAEGSKIKMSDGLTLTCDESPEKLAGLIRLYVYPQ